MRAIVSASTTGEITSASPGTHLRRDSLQLTDTKLFTVSNHETVVSSPWSFSVGDRPVTQNRRWRRQLLDVR